jgi:hypothetical protein
VTPFAALLGAAVVLVVVVVVVVVGTSLTRSWT